MGGHVTYIGETKNVFTFAVPVPLY